MTQAQLEMNYSAAKAANEGAELALKNGLKRFRAGQLAPLAMQTLYDQQRDATNALITAKFKAFISHEFLY
jgi:adenine C2-methylase RlmN of 23S rRNA A2503 and tRNA A37